MCSSNPPHRQQALSPYPCQANFSFKYSTEISMASPNELTKLLINSLGNQLPQFSKPKCTVQDKNQHCDDPWCKICCNETELSRVKGSEKNFIHTRNADLGIFLYQNKPLMVTYICALTELYNIYKHIYRKNNNNKNQLLRFLNINHHLLPLHHWSRIS